ncbi:defective proboscis extension response 12 [Carabus blaptoides fortunei]
MSAAYSQYAAIYRKLTQGSRMWLDPASWCALFLLGLPTVLLTTSTDFRNKEVYTYPEWRRHWYSAHDNHGRGAKNGYGRGKNNTVTNVTVQLGATGFLHCHIRTMVERTIIGAEHVLWVRRRDWHILSSGMLTYTNDERFQILHTEGSDDWILQIKYVQKRDNGTYECQVATGGGLMSHFVHLRIVTPKAYIQGSSGEHHVDMGSVIRLVCIIEKSPIPPQYVFWYHNDRMINYDTARGGITVETRPGPQTQSLLTIEQAQDSDSGNYTCSASNTRPASIYVFVQEGDNTAAILRRESSSAIELKRALALTIILPLLCILR